MKSTEEPLAGRPAGRPADAEGQQPEGVLILNSRDERALSWLIDAVGIAAVRDSIKALAGGRRPYVTNLAKALGLAIPAEVITTPSDEALARIAELRRAGLVARGSL